MNRRILIQVAAPSVLVGVLLLGTCLASDWYINRLQENLGRVLSQNVAGLQLAQELEIRVRQLRFHCFLYLIDPRPDRLAPIDQDNQGFESTLKAAQRAVQSPEERACVEEITRGYQQY